MKKKILALCLVVVLAVTAVTGATLAYFTDTDDAVNTFALGNVKIEQKEVDENGNPFEQDQIVYPIIDAGDKYNDPNYIWKKVSVKNTGSEACYVRTFIAFPLINNNSTDNNAANNWLHWNGSSDTDKEAEYADNGWYWDKNLTVDWPGNGGEWNEFNTTIGDKPYKVFVTTNADVLNPGNETKCNLRGFYLDSSVDCETLADGTLNYYYNYNGTKFDLGDISELEIPVFSQAVQATGFVDENKNGTAADEAFAASGLPTNPWAPTT